MNVLFSITSLTSIITPVSSAIVYKPYKCHGKDGHFCDQSTSGKIT